MFKFIKEAWYNSTRSADTPQTREEWLLAECDRLDSLVMDLSQAILKIRSAKCCSDGVLMILCREHSNHLDEWRLAVATLDKEYPNLQKAAIWFNTKEDGL